MKLILLLGPLQEFSQQTPSVSSPISVQNQVQPPQPTFEINTLPTSNINKPPFSSFYNSSTTFGYFINTDSTFGNSILPVLPRF